MASDLLTALRAHLVTSGIARVPSVAGTGHPMWLEPRNGTPAPGEGDNAVEKDPDAVLGAFNSGGIPANPYESFFRTDTVDIWIRTRTAPLAFSLEAQIRDACIDRRNWFMSDRHVIDCEEWHKLQRLPAGNEGQQGYTFIYALVFQTYVDPAL